MFKNILIPTDGSDLAAKAVEQGVLFAKEVGAKITAMTVTEPFPPHLGSVGSNELEYAPIEYMKHAEATPRRCSVRYRLRPTQQVSPARCFTSSTDTSIRQSSMLPRPGSAI